MDRIHDRWTTEDFRQLEKYSLEEFNRFINQVGGGRYKPYENKLIAICLCQGGAQHYTGI